MQKILSILILIIVINVNAYSLEKNTIIISDEYYSTGIYMNDYTIKGNGEECKLTYDSEDKTLIHTTCLSLTNSKGINIFCSKKKRICKTENEILNLLNPQIEKQNFDNNVLKQWVNAHNTLDMNQLTNLYSKEITYYGKKLPRNKCIEDKKRVLGKYPQFRVRVENIQYISVTPTLTKITFDKYIKFNFKKKEKMYPSYLLIDLTSNSIIVEGDTVTDKNIKKNKSTYVTTKGTEFKTIINKHGAVLKSKSFTIYLGKDCDVSSPQFGEGTWKRDKGGFYLTFNEGKNITFKNQRAPTGECWWLDSKPKEKTEEVPMGYDYSRNKVVESKSYDTDTKETLSPKELCKRAEDNFSKSYEKFTNAQLNPNENSDSIFRKQLEARDLALVFIKQCKNVHRNILWNGGYKMDEIKNFILNTNAIQRIANDLEFEKLLGR